jgi:hypothetical protein
VLYVASRNSATQYSHASSASQPQNLTCLDLRLMPRAASAPAFSSPETRPTTRRSIFVGRQVVAPRVPEVLLYGLTSRRIMYCSVRGVAVIDLGYLWSFNSWRTRISRWMTVSDGAREWIAPEPDRATLSYLPRNPTSHVLHALAYFRTELGAV